VLLAGLHRSDRCTTLVRPVQVWADRGLVFMPVKSLVLVQEVIVLVVVTPSFKGKTECIDHVCVRIKLHTRLDIMITKNSATRIKSYYKP
jgi:hypothetical protein